MFLKLDATLENETLWFFSHFRQQLYRNVNGKGLWYTWLSHKGGIWTK